MATRKKKNKKKTFFWQDDRVRFITGLVIATFAVFTLIVLISYIYNWDAYQSGAKTSPTTGNLGYKWSNLLMGEWFGLAAFSIPLILAVISFRMLKFRLVHFYKIIIAALTGSILFSVLLGFVFGHLMTGTKGLIGKGLGGITGDTISELMINTIGIAGTALLLLLFISIWGIYISKKFMHWQSNVGGSFLNLFKKKNNVDDSDDEENDEDEIELDEDEEDSEDSTEEEETEEEETSGEEDDDDITIEVIQEEEEDTTFKETELTLYDPTKELSHYKKPTIDLLDDHKGKGTRPSDKELEQNKNRIVRTLSNYKIGIDKIIATIGPTVTLYEIVPQAGVRIAAIKRLEDDIALSLSALGVRIIAPIPGKGTVGIEVPNQYPDIVSMLSVIKSSKFQEAAYDLPVVLGKTISNETYTFDLAKMPHLLVAGATGQGKSVGLNAILTSLLYRKHPSEMKLVLVDPKKVELTLYSKLERHFLAKLPDSEEAIITDTQKVVYTLKSLCLEMDSRYDLLKLAQVRNIKEYNERFVNHRLNPQKGHRYLPFIVVVIDEFADLIMTAGREVEEPIARLAQLARAIGIHLVIATQRPTTNIITGLIKANFPARIAFRVISGIDSRTILDTTGANQLIGRGDMLVSSGSEMIRVQCAFVDTPEVERISKFIGDQQGYSTAFELPEYTCADSEEKTPGAVDLSDRDPLFDEAARLIVIHQQGSTSLIQRKFSIGYNRAGRLMDQLEAAGIVGAQQGAKAREVFIQDEYSLEKLLDSLK